MWLHGPLDMPLLLCVFVLNGTAPASKEIFWLEEHLRNDLFCVERDIKRFPFPCSCVFFATTTATHSFSCELFTAISVPRLTQPTLLSGLGPIV